jgi:hypothetical protein
MKKIRSFTGFLAVSALTLTFASCTPSKSAVRTTAQPEPPPPPNSYYTGDGGKGVSIAILAPQASGLTKDLEYLPALVQGEFVSNFSGYSAIAVLDRQRLDTQYSELLSGYYDENAAEGLDLGHLPPTTYIMGGNITKTSSGYAMQIQITKTADKTTLFSYSGTCTVAELDNFTGIRRASLDLLQKMGITPTETARTELSGAAAANRVSGQTALAQGITAQRRGGEVESMTYLYQAAAYDPSLLEAASRVSVLAANISSGNIGEDRRNDIRWRNDWIARLNEANTFFTDYLDKNQPPCEIVYSTNMEAGKTDYSTETVPFTFPVRLFTGRAYFASLEKSVQTVADGLAATGQNGEWRLGWPGNFARSRSVAYDLDFDLMNSGGTVIGTRRVRLDFGWGISGGNRIEVSRPSPGTQQVTITADANGITDVLTIRVRAVNGRNPQLANVQISAISERPPSDNDYRFDRLTGELYGASNVYAIPATIWGAPVTSIGDNAEISSLNFSITPVDLDRFDREMTGRKMSRDDMEATARLRQMMVSESEGVQRAIPLSVKRIGHKAIKLEPKRLGERRSSKPSFSQARGDGFSIYIDAGFSLQRDSFFTTADRFFSYFGAETKDRSFLLNGSPGDLFGFTNFYNRNGKKAGTYIFTVRNGSSEEIGKGYQWYYEP